MKPVLDFVQGLLSYDEFEAELYADPAVWEYIQNLVTEDIRDQSSKFWEGRHPFMWGFATNDFSVKSTLTAFDFNGSMAHSLISALVTYHDPSIVSHEPPSEEWDDILIRLKLDYIGGDEVDDLLRITIASHQGESTRAVRAALKELFPTASRKIPQWVQEPEWPMGRLTPMQFVKQVTEGERVTYFFRDADTGETREIVQYY